MLEEEVFSHFSRSKVTFLELTQASLVGGPHLPKRVFWGGTAGAGGRRWTPGWVTRGQDPLLEEGGQGMSRNKPQGT